MDASLFSVIPKREEPLPLTSTESAPEFVIDSFKMLRNGNFLKRAGERSFLTEDAM